MMQAWLQLKGMTPVGHLAMETIDAETRTERNRAILAALVMISPGKTSAEYSRMAECKCFGDSIHHRRTEAARRLPQLEKVMKVRQGRKRKCAVTKTHCFTWWPYSFGGASA